MPTVRHQKPRNRFGEVTPYQLAVLLDQDPGEATAADRWWQVVEAGADQPTDAWHATSLAALWTVHEPALLPLWLAHNPGKRPSCWWRYSAPEPERRRLCGRGTPKSEVLAHLPTFWCGMPDDWITADDLRTWPDLMCEPYDPADPPTFEAEAAYLERHRLFMPGERRRLRKADFEPEAAELG